MDAPTVMEASLRRSAGKMVSLSPTQALVDTRVSRFNILK